MVAESFPAVTTRPRRATGTSLAAIVLALVCFGAVMALHLLRGDMDPVQRVMSEYANGSYGRVMTAAFYAFGLATLALAFRLRSAVAHIGAARLVPYLLATSGTALLLSGAFEVGPPLLSDTVEEVIHSAASMAAFVLLIAAMLLFSYAVRADPQWRTFGWISWPLSVAAAVTAMLSPWAGQTSWAGIMQRTLGLTVLAWLIATPVRIRLNALGRAV